MKEYYRKEFPITSMLGFGGGGSGLSINKGGGALEDLPFSATGGSKSGPSGGYYYHTFEEGSSTFEITSGKGQVEVAIVGGGGAGGGGGPPSGDEAGAGGGGAGVGIFTIGELMPGSYSVSVGSGAPGASYPPSYNPGGAGGTSVFSGPPNYPGAVYGPAGNPSTWYNNPYASSGGSGSWPSSPTFVTNASYPGGPGGNGDNRPPHPSRNYGPINGGSGGHAGHYNNPGWWSPYMGPGQGGGSPSPWPPGRTGYGYNASYYGGGGGGGGRGGSGGSGRPGRIIIRYPDSI